MFLESSPSNSQKSTRSSAARSTPTKSSSEAPKFSPSRPRPSPGSSTCQSKLRSPDSEASRWTASKETNTLQPLNEGQVTKEFKAEAPLMRSEVIDGIRYTYYEDDMKEAEKMTPQECINFLQEHAGEELPAIFQGGQEQSEGQQAAEKLHLKTEVIDGIAYTYYQKIWMKLS
ncbi:hypothetical protein WJX75_009702 [Coccomyxa subellipsoidea]|uniref:Uncharacterized protein n=1 Tax=Coccomyxa subellipsoidea TaxID=248742 RepID=A0ABR2Z666_9CHLO